MKKKLKKNSLLESAFINYISLIFVRVLGALYNIPFYSLIGPQGGFIYSFVYNIYSLFLEISTSGIPTAISIVMGEYNSLKKYKSKEKAYKLARYFVGFISFTSFIILQFFSIDIANYFLEGVHEGISTEDLALSIKIVSLCLLIVPFLSVERGYLKGHKFISSASKSQVLEQLVRVVLVLVLAFIVIRIFNMEAKYGVYVSLVAAFVAAFVSYLYIKREKNNSIELFETESSEEKAEDSKVILKKMISYSFVTVILSVSYIIYGIVDMKLLLVGLSNIGYNADDVRVISSIASDWIPKITYIVSSVAIGMTGSIAPYIADSYAVRDYKSLNYKINQALIVVLTVMMPLTIGVAMFSGEVYNIFYGASDFGGKILFFSLILNFIGGITNLLSIILQSMGKGKIVVSAIIIGILINASLDLPLIYLFNDLGISAYLGASIASIIGEIISFSILVYYLNKNISLDFKPMFKFLKNSFLPLLYMFIVVFVFSKLLPISTDSRIIQTLYLLLAGIIGMVVYFPTAYRKGILDFLIHSDKFSKIFNKFLYRKNSGNE